MIVYPLRPTTPLPRGVPRMSWCLVDARDHRRLVRWVAAVAARAAVPRYGVDDPSSYDPRYLVRHGEQPVAVYTAAVMAGRPVLVLRSNGGLGTQFFTVLDHPADPTWRTDT